MTGWYASWQTAVAWLVVTAMASVIYFGFLSMGRKRLEMTAQWVSATPPPAAD